MVESSEGIFFTRFLSDETELCEEKKKCKLHPNNNNHPPVIEAPT